MIDEIELSERLHGIEVQTPPGLADRTARLGRRRVLRRRSAVVAAVAGIGVVGAVTVTGPLGIAHGSGGRVSYVSAAAGPSAYAGLPCPTAKPSTYVARDPGLEAVCLPTPAPGFPVVRGGPMLTNTSSGYELHAGGVPTVTFLLAVTPGLVTNGGYGSSPSGAEATVIVARKGSWPTTPDAVAARHVDAVVGTATIRGVTGTVVRVAKHQTGILIELGGFDVQAYGFDGPGGGTASVADIATLVDSLQNLG